MNRPSDRELTIVSSYNLPQAVHLVPYLHNSEIFVECRLKLLATAACPAAVYRNDHEFHLRCEKGLPIEGEFCCNDLRNGAAVTEK